MRLALFWIGVLVHTVAVIGNQSMIIDSINLPKDHSIKIETTSIDSVQPENGKSSFKPVEIREFQKFMEKSLKKKVLEYSSKPLTKPGDNFGAVLQAVDVKLLANNQSNEIETLHLVSKSIPSAFERDLFVSEVHFYSDIIPAIEQFQQIANITESQRIDAFVRHFGSRLSLNAYASYADSDALILLENAKPLNYSVLDRFDRFDKDETMAILKQLAKFHALPIAMRRLQPKLFYSKVDPYLYNLDTNYEWQIAVAEQFASKLPTVFPNMTEKMLNAIKKHMEIGKAFFRNNDRVQDTPYTTINHWDLWVKNFLIKKEDESIKVKILDFAWFNYESFALDLTFFLFINVQDKDLRTNFKQFFDYYHSEFVNILRLVDYPLDEYTYEKMWNEVKKKAKVNLIWIYVQLAITQIMILQPGQLITFDMVDTDYLELPPPELILNTWKCVNDLYFELEFL